MHGKEPSANLRAAWLTSPLRTGVLVSMSPGSETAVVLGWMDPFQWLPDLKSLTPHVHRCSSGIKADMTRTGSSDGFLLPPAT